MKIVFIKDHLNYEKGKSYEIDNGVAEYLIKLKVAKEEIKTKEGKVVKKTK